MSGISKQMNVNKSLKYPDIWEIYEEKTSNCYFASNRYSYFIKYYYYYYHRRMTWTNIHINEIGRLHAKKNWDMSSDYFCHVSKDSKKYFRINHWMHNSNTKYKEKVEIRISENLYISSHSMRPEFYSLSLSDDRPINSF